MGWSIKELGRRIAELRKARGVTQQVFAETAGLNYRHYQNIEAGKADLRLVTLLKIARHLHVSPSMLFEAAPDPAAQKTTRYFRQILDTVPCGVQVNDLDGIITYSNPAHRALHGYSSRELIGKKAIWDLVATSEDREELKRYFRKLLEGKTKPVPFFTRNRRKDGTTVEVRVDWRYLCDRKGKLVGFISGIVPTR